MLLKRALLSCLCLGLMILPALAQPATVAPSLPPPPLDENARPSAFLDASLTALLSGRTGEAQESLEMAQTRLLDRSVPLYQTGNPSDNPAVRQIGQALAALQAGDRVGCARLIRQALDTAHAQGL